MPRGCLDGSTRLGEVLTDLAARTTALLGANSPWRVHWVAETGSTNPDVAELARRAEPEGYVLVADHQTAGRGRFERSWVAPPGAAVAISVLLRPQRPPLDWGWLSLLVGLGVTAALRELGGERVTLKWPNDALVDGKKICGILSELVSTDQGPAAVCGWGVNVALRAEDLPVPHATSLLLAGLPIERSQLVAAMLRQVGDLARRWDAGADLRAEYAAGCSTIGRQVRVHLDEQSPQGPSVTGRAIGVGVDGELLVDLGRDGVQGFAAGDVVHLR